MTIDSVPIASRRDCSPLRFKFWRYDVLPGPVHLRAHLPDQRHIAEPAVLYCSVKPSSEMLPSVTSAV